MILHAQVDNTYAHILTDSDHELIYADLSLAHPTPPHNMTRDYPSLYPTALSQTYPSN